MKEKFSVGDVVLSVAGRDEGKYFLVVGLECDYAFIVDGRTRKVNSPKRKKVKHLRMISVAGAKELAMKISVGKPVANERVYKSVKAVKEKLQED